MSINETEVKAAGTEGQTGVVSQDAEQIPNTSDTKQIEPPKSRKRHGKGFVYLSLSDSDEALRKIDSHAKEMSVGQFATALGHKRPSGRFLHKLDALKTYELILPECSDSVTLTPLAEDMLYGAAKAKARTTAFLNCPEFKKLYIDFPKAHDNKRSDVVDYIKAKLGIVNEVDRFLRLFLESAKCAGLLEGPASTTASVIRLLAAPMSSNSEAKDTAVDKSATAYSVMSADEVDDFLDAAGLTKYKQHAEVQQQTTGRFTLKVADGGKITVEIHRPVQITIQPEDLISDLPKILEAMQEKGLKA